MAKTKKIKEKKVKKSEAVSENTSVEFKPIRDQDMKLVEEQTVARFSNDALRVYGSYVVEERAIADFRDGLKPSHRAVLWSLCGLGLRPSSGFKKAARTVGDAIGKYHPHGDGGTYGAMVTIANTVPPIVDGQGNWGTPVDPAAAYRYTEAKMSKFAHMFMADSKYLEVATKVPNFSNDDSIPLYMPALLPYMLFNGSVPPPAYGVRAGNPAFTFESVAKVVCTMLRGEKLDSKALAKVLKIQHEFGCEDITAKKDYATFIATGRGNIEYAPLMESDHKKRLIQIRSFCPGTLSSDNNIEKTLMKLRQIPGVTKAYSAQGKKSKGSGPYGALFNVEVQKSVSEDRFEEILEKIDNIICSKVNYRLGVTIRKKEDANAFKYLNFEQFFAAWIKYRINLEMKMIKHLLGAAERDLHINEVYLFAIRNMDKILKALPKVLVAKDPDATLAKLLNIPVEDATIILDRKVRQLAKLEEADLLAKIKTLKAEIAQLKKDQKDPGGRAARDTDERVEKYLKNPDRLPSGIIIGAKGKKAK